MRWVFTLSYSSILLSLPATTARAQSASNTAREPDASAFLSVTREDGAESCPDTAALRQHVERLRGDQATSEPSAYRVNFSYRNGVFRADIRVGQAGELRVLRDRRATCASLEQATALTLALLLDSDAGDLAPPRQESRAPTIDARPGPLPPLPPTPRPRIRAASLTASVGGAGLFGIVRPVAPIVLADLGIGVNRFRTSIGAVWMPSQTLDFGPGQLHETLLSGVARTCLAAVRGGSLRFDVCSGFYAGRLKVHAVHYTRNDSVDKVWLAVPLELAVATSSPLGLELGATALFQLRRNEFSVDELGIAYVSWPVGMLLSLRAVGGWLL
jgi:hypothetical protein